MPRANTPFQGEAEHDTKYFCSEECMEEYEYHPEDYPELVKERPEDED
ncbi:MAG: hypothetical protein M1133_10885 [Armatimonadetes bacterium]|nr:hypothetical protein [Armatimonadota bacterium]